MEKHRAVMLEITKKGLKVAYYEKGSLSLLRIAKGVVVLGLTWLPSGTRWFWTSVLGLLPAGSPVHKVHQHGTQGWTRLRGEWQDVETVSLVGPKQGGK